MTGRSAVVLAAIVCACGPRSSRYDDAASGDAGSGTTGEAGTSFEMSATDTGEDGDHSTTANTDGEDERDESTEGGGPGSTGTGSGTLASTGFVAPDCPNIHEGDVFIGEDGDFEPLAGVWRITGRLTIWGPDVVDLAPLACLRRADGGLTIRDNPGLESLHGLEQLENVGGTLSIARNDSLETLGPLANLEAVAHLVVSGNQSLTDLNMSSLQSFGELLLGVCDDSYNEEHDNPALESLDGLSALSSLTRVRIHSQSGLSDIDLLHSLAESGGFQNSGNSVFSFNLSLPYEDIVLFEQLGVPEGVELYSCGNLGEPESNECYCDPG